MSDEQDGEWTMLEANTTAAVSTGLVAPASIEFFAIQIGFAADGLFYVSVGATICECEGELSQMDMGNHRVASIDDAIEVIRQTITHAH
jgi:hypothetical protein